MGWLRREHEIFDGCIGDVSRNVQGRRAAAARAKPPPDIPSHADRNARPHEAEAFAFLFRTLLIDIIGPGGQFPANKSRLQPPLFLVSWTEILLPMILSSITYGVTTMRQATFVPLSILCISLASCTGFDKGTAGSIQNVQISTKDLCGILPTAQSVAAIVATLHPGSAIASSTIPVMDVAKELCAAFPQDMLRSRRSGTLVDGETATGVAVQGFVLERGAPG